MAGFSGEGGVSGDGKFGSPYRTSADHGQPDPADFCLFEMKREHKCVTILRDIEWTARFSELQLFCGWDKDSSSKYHLKIDGKPSLTLKNLKYEDSPVDPAPLEKYIESTSGQPHTLLKGECSIKEVSVIYEPRFSSGDYIEYIANSAGNAGLYIPKKALRMFFSPLEDLLRGAATDAAGFFVRSEAFWDRYNLQHSYR